MKKIVAILLLNTIIYLGFAQKITNETEKLANLCKVWGFLKYYHPVVASGKFDWDKELINEMNNFKSANTKEAINKEYVDWINGLGIVEKCDDCKNNIPDSLKYNLNLDWLNDTLVFNKEIISKLNYIKENRTKNQFYFGRETNENPYIDSIFPSMEFRLLCLFRYWNIINYFYPYKYKTDTNWNVVLTEMLPKFQFAKDTMEYHLAMLELTTKINDSHSLLKTPYTKKFFGIYYPLFRCRIIDNKAIVTGFWNDSIENSNDIQIGDVIIKINNKDLADLIKEKEKYIGASNEATKLRNLSYRLFNSNIDSTQITYERNGELKTKMIKLYLYEDFHKAWLKIKGPVSKEIDDSIGYVKMGILQIEQVDSVMKIMMHKKAIIFDVRYTPNGTYSAISAYLNKNIVPFVKFVGQDLKYPGVIKWERYSYCGKEENLDFYKGKVIVLFDEQTQSHGEFTCMALQTAPNVKCIGSQTAGADGNVTKIMLPGGYETWLTGIGVYYPDGRETQRIGIVPDIEVHPTIEGIKKGKDEVLDRAIEYINTGK